MTVNMSCNNILLADDDPDDRLMITEAFLEADPATRPHCVEDGEQLLDFLYRRGAYAAPSHAPRPRLILLDLNMPRVDGREAIAAIRRDDELRRIPIIVLTTSDDDDDVATSYDLGVNSFITKPMTFDDLVAMARALGQYWFQIVALPDSSNGQGR